MLPVFYRFRHLQATQDTPTGRIHKAALTLGPAAVALFQSLAHVPRPLR
jgi:hypothetical protein